MKKELIELIWSHDLREIIEGTGFDVENERAFVEQYAPDLETLCRFLPGNNQKTAFESFKKSEDDCIYELHIKTDENAYDERYICSDYDKALSRIDDFMKEYDITPTEETKYEITKRRIYDGTYGFFEDYAGSVTLNSDKSIYRVWTKESGDEYEDIYFPSFIKNRELVRYIDGSEKYGIAFCDESKSVSSYTIYPLDTPSMRNRNFEFATDAHVHISPCFTERADKRIVPRDIRNIYNAYIDYLSTSGNKSGYFEMIINKNNADFEKILELLENRLREARYSINNLISDNRKYVVTGSFMTENEVSDDYVADVIFSVVGNKCNIKEGNSYFVYSSSNENLYLNIGLLKKL